jgi:hypothetical protein
MGSRKAILSITAFLAISVSAHAALVSCAVGGGNTPAGWTLNGVGGGLAASSVPFVGPSGFATDCYIVTDTGAGWPGTTTTGFYMTGALGDPGIPNTTNGSQMISPAFTAAAGSQLIFDFMFATNDGTDTFSDWANVALVPTQGGQPIFLFTARTGYNSQVVPGYGFSNLAPGLVLTPGTAFLKGDTWYLDATTGDTSASNPNATQFGSLRYPGDAIGGSSDWNHAVFTFDPTTAGSYQLVMNVGNVGDEVYSSALFFSGYSISPNPVTPEPGTLLLLGSGALGIAGAVRRRLGK